LPQLVVNNNYKHKSLYLYNFVEKLMVKNSTHISTLSKHLFWDIDAEALDFEDNKDIIIKRVLQYGFFSDWVFIYKFYGLKTITKVARKLRDIDEKSLYYISKLSNRPLASFFCNTAKQPIQKP